MSSSASKITFQSALAPLMEQFVQEKRACGYRYDSPTRLLMRFDRFLSDEAPQEAALSRSVARQWLAKRPHESAATHRHRITVLRQFATFLCRLGHPAYVPDASLAVRGGTSFSLRILTHAEVRRLLRAVDQLTPSARP